MNNEAHNLVLTNEELGVIFEALSNQQYKVAAPVIMILQNQLQAEAEEKKKKFAEESKIELKPEKK